MGNASHASMSAFLHQGYRRYSDISIFSFISHQKLSIDFIATHDYRYRSLAIVQSLAFPLTIVRLESKKSTLPHRFSVVFLGSIIFHGSSEYCGRKFSVKKLIAQRSEM